jgi:hypothetical protein
MAKDNLENKSKSNQRDTSMPIRTRSKPVITIAFCGGDPNMSEDAYLRLARKYANKVIEYNQQR